MEQAPVAPTSSPVVSAPADEERSINDPSSNIVNIPAPIRVVGATASNSVPANTTGPAQHVDLLTSLSPGLDQYRSGAQTDRRLSFTKAELGFTPDITGLC